jgi:multidrug transporter EmrE-like cation transporter
MNTGAIRIGNFKEWVITNKISFFVIGFFIIGCLFLIFSYKKMNIAVASLIYIIFNVVALTLVSWFYYNEKLTAVQLIGLCLGLVSVVLLET